MRAARTDTTKRSASANAYLTIATGKGLRSPAVLAPIGCADRRATDVARGE